MEKDQTLSNIRYGFVLNHLDENTHEIIEDILDMNTIQNLYSAQGVKSTRYGRKDMIKVEFEDPSELEVFLETIEENIPKIALVSKHCTVNIIKDWEISDKYKNPPRYLLFS